MLKVIVHIADTKLPIEYNLLSPSPLHICSIIDENIKKFRKELVKSLPKKAQKRYKKKIKEDENKDEFVQ